MVGFWLGWSDGFDDKLGDWDGIDVGQSDTEGLVVGCLEGCVDIEGA